jgi:hypothetical protein
MKKALAVAALMIPFALAGCSHPRPYYPPPPPPPPAYTQAAQQGYHDGIEAGNHDVSRGAPPDVNRHPRFRRPPVPPPLAEEYRHGFRDGYGQVYGRGPVPPPRSY